MIFKDRHQAGQLLAKQLSTYQNTPQTIVLGIPRGGVVVAAEIAAKLNLPLDVVITRKIGAPAQKELAIGAINPSGQVIWDQNLIAEFDLRDEQLQELAASELTELKRRDQLYRRNHRLNVENQTIILVDDGIATGLTMLSAIQYLRAAEAKAIIVAVPVAAQASLQPISNQVDQVISLATEPELLSVGSYYHQFLPVSDQEVINLL